jgi:signal transduction histidine kinase
VTFRVTPRSVRGKAVLGSGLAIAVFGALLGLAAYLVVTQSATSSVLAAIDARISEVSDQLTEQAAENPGAVDLEPIGGVDPTYIQVVTPAGDVVAASPGLSAQVNLCPSPLPTTATQDRVSLSPTATVGTYVRVVSPVSAGGADVVVCAIGSDDPITRAQDAVLLALLLALPLLVLAVCIVVWLAVGRALHAVEDMRSQADSMQSTASDLLRVPDTGDEVEQLGHTLNGLLGRLHQQTRATRQFVADAGHELRNPLSTLRVTLEFGQDADEAELRASVRDALADLDRLEVLTQDLLVLARSDAQESAPALVTMDLADVVTEAVAATRRGNPGVTVTAQTQSCTVAADPAALRSLLSNLLDNAARHARSVVAVDVHPEGSSAIVRVDDDGHGLAPEDCAVVFERFVRLDEARNRDAGGSGLGLAIVAAIAEAHGGSVRAEPGPGGHFVVMLPQSTESRSSESG